MEEFHITSLSFKDGGHIPRKYTEDAQNNKHDFSPSIVWHGVPEGTESLALIMEDIDAPDPDSPIAPFTHWVLYNIPPAIKQLPEGFRAKDQKEGSELAEIQEGVNDNKLPGYRGPCPPKGTHRYVFRVYALDCRLRLGHKVSKEKLEEAMQGHILAEARFMGTYTKEKGAMKEANATRMPPQVKEQTIIS